VLLNAEPLQPSGKIFSKKRARKLTKRDQAEWNALLKKKAPSIELVSGIPGSDLDIGIAGLLSNLDKDTELGEITRIQFEGLFEDCVVRLLQLMREQGTVAEKWAGNVVGRLYGSLHKQHKRHCDENAAYSNTVKKITEGIRSDVLRPYSPASQILQRELRAALRHYFMLKLLLERSKRQPRPWVGSVDRRAVFERVRDQRVMQHLAGGSGVLWTNEGMTAIEKAAREARPPFFYPDEIIGKRRSTWKDVARNWKIPEAYWPLKDFPPFEIPEAYRQRRDFPTDVERQWWDSISKQWWDFIWSRLSERQVEILPCLIKKTKKRSEKSKEMGSDLRLNAFYGQFHNAWLSIAAARLAGTF
jgi:hypothetical protein